MELFTAHDFPWVELEGQGWVVYGPLGSPGCVQGLSPLEKWIIDLDRFP